MSDEITITYETLFEISRNEKNKVEIQKLPETFYDDVINYMKEKQEFIDKTKKEVFSEETSKNKELELSNIKKIIKDIYNKREHKIITLARDKSRTKSNLFDTSNLLKEENDFFDKCVQTLNTNRDSILTHLLNGTLIPGRTPLIKKELPPITTSQTAQPEVKTNDPEVKTNEPLIKMIRFLDSVPKFVGPELEEYGPFQKEDMASLPSQIANVLINKSRAEEIKPT